MSLQLYQLDGLSCTLENMMENLELGAPDTPVLKPLDLEFQEETNMP